MNVAHLVASFGYLALFVLVAVESLGIPLPGETTLIVAAAAIVIGFVLTRRRIADLAVKAEQAYPGPLA